MSEYRHEYKYIINGKEDALLSSISKGIMKSDLHTDETGRYYIRSLYFDDYADSCFFENESGVNYRHKYRLRYYDRDLNYIVLEKKSKINGMTSKKSYRVSVEEAKMLIEGAGDYSLVNNPLAKEMTLKGMIPKIIVSYEREPFVYEAGNVRVTFDRGISSSAEIERFLDGDYGTRPVMPSGSNVLEIKWDELLPGFIKDSLCTRELTWSAYSKYYMCRRYN